MAPDPLHPQWNSLEVWKGLRANDPRGIEAYKKLLAYLTREAAAHPRFGMLRDVTADDVAQEVLLRGLKDPALTDGKFEHRGPGSLRAYLRRFVDSVVCDELRKQTALKRGAGGVVRSLDADTPSGRHVQEPQSPDPSPTGAAVASELGRGLLAGLSPREREVWQLRVQEGLGFEAIGRRLGMSGSAVRSLYYRIATRLKYVRRPH